LLFNNLFQYKLIDQGKYL